MLSVHFLAVDHGDSEDEPEPMALYMGLKDDSPISRKQRSRTVLDAVRRAEEEESRGRTISTPTVGDLLSGSGFGQTLDFGCMRR
jgi:hypothetical protein